MPGLKPIFLVGLGGAIGSILRFFVSYLTLKKTDSFPLDTLTVNLLGSFLLAFLLSMALYKTNVNKILLIFFTTGVIGSFTTYSTIVIDYFLLINTSNLAFILYVIATFFGGLCMAFLGLIAGKKVWSI